LRYAKFGPIITYSSAHHFEYLKSLGAAICIDRKQVSFADLPAAVKKLTDSPIKVVYDAIGSGESEQAGYDVLADDGNMVTTGARGKIDSKKIHRVFGSVHTPPPNREFGREMYKNLTKLLEDGVIVVSVLYMLQVPVLLIRTFFVAQQNRGSSERFEWDQ